MRLVLYYLLFDFQAVVFQHDVTLCVVTCCVACTACVICFFLMRRRPPRSTLDRSSAASDVYKRQVNELPGQPGGAREAGCAEVLVFEGERWRRRPV